MYLFIILEFWFCTITTRLATNWAIKNARCQRNQGFYLEHRRRNLRPRLYRLSILQTKTIIIDKTVTHKIGDDYAGLVMLGIIFIIIMLFKNYHNVFKYLKRKQLPYIQTLKITDEFIMLGIKGMWEISYSWGSIIQANI